MSDQYATGLEDFNPNEAAVPRIEIDHEGGVFKNRLSGEEFPEMYAIILGLVKQRVFWPKEVRDKGKPFCKSSDFAVGYPLMEGAREDLFPWDGSGLDPSAMPKDEYDRITIPCEACKFAQWGQDRTPPACSERHTFPLFFSTEDDGLYNGSSGIISFQRSGITPSRNYISAFARGKKPLYTVVTKISLDRHKRGKVTYSTPVFKKVGDVEEGRWLELSQEYNGLREFLRRAPRPSDEAAEAAGAVASKQSGGGYSAPAQASSVVESTATEDPWAATPATSLVGGDDDDLPF